MITKIYEDYEEKISEPVVRCVQKEVEEEYFVQVPITRYHRNGPTGTSNCLHCGRVLEQRMWEHLKKESAFLCKNCWYSLDKTQIEHYANLRKQGIDSVEHTIDYQIRTRKIPKLV